MNLAICHPAVVPALGGCETYIADLCRRLDHDGHAIHVYSSQIDAAALPASVTHHVIADKGRPRFLRPWRFSRACNEATRGKGHDLTISFDKVSGVDVVYPLAGTYLGTVDHNLGKFRAKPVRRVASWVRFLDPAAWSFWAFERDQFVREKPPFVIANSDFVRRHFKRYFGIAPSSVSVLHCAIDPDRFAATDRPARRVELRQHWNVQPTDTVALFVAMNYRLKGLEPLLRAVARMPDRSRFRLAIVGSAHTAPWERLAKRLGVAETCRFLGFSADPRNAYFAADLLVHPTFYDPCSLVVQEARACGLPVITTKFNGAAELLDPPHDGLVVRDPHDAEELAGAMGYFLDPARRRACAAAAYRNGQAWTFEKHYARLMDLLRQAVARKKAA